MITPTTPIITADVFIRCWVTAYRKGMSLTWLASKMGRKIKSLQARADSLANIGIVLPLIREGSIGEELQRLCTLADIADGLLPPS